VLRGEQRVYFVVETKGSAGQLTPIDQQTLRGREELKIACGTGHFAVFEPLGVAYQVAANLEQVG